MVFLFISPLPGSESACHVMELGKGPHPSLTDMPWILREGLDHQVGVGPCREAAWSPSLTCDLSWRKLWQWSWDPAGPIRFSAGGWGEALFLKSKGAAGRPDRQGCE